MGARGLIDKGLIKGIENGKSTRIWEHKWIPETIIGKPTTSRSNNCELKMVDELICHNRENRNIIFWTFNRNDVERILSIPLTLFGRKTVIFGNHMLKGRTQSTQAIKSWWRKIVVQGNAILMKLAQVTQMEVNKRHRCGTHSRGSTLNTKSRFSSGNV